MVINYTANPQRGWSSKVLDHHLIANLLITVRCGVVSCCDDWRRRTETVRILSGGLGVGGVLDRHASTGVHCCQVLLQKVVRVDVHFDRFVVRR